MMSDNEIKEEIIQIIFRDYDKAVNKFKQNSSATNWRNLENSMYAVQAVQQPHYFTNTKVKKLYTEVGIGMITAFIAQDRREEEERAVARTN